MDVAGAQFSGSHIKTICDESAIGAADIDRPRRSHKFSQQRAGHVRAAAARDVHRTSATATDATDTADGRCPQVCTAGEIDRAVAQGAAAEKEASVPDRGSILHVQRARCDFAHGDVVAITERDEVVGVPDGVSAGGGEATTVNPSIAARKRTAGSAFHHKAAAKEVEFIGILCSRNVEIEGIC